MSSSSNSLAPNRTRFVDRWSSERLQEWLKGIDGFVFDCDGVLWEGKREIPNSGLLLHQLATLGKKVVFVTNNATKTTAEFIEKFQSFKMPLPSHDSLMSSGIATARYLAKHLSKGDKVYVVGDPGLHTTLQEHGMTTVGLDHAGLNFSDFAKLGPETVKKDKSFKAVVVSFDGNFNYFKLAYAATLVRYNPNMLFVATNKDQASPLIPGMLVPGGGSIVCSVETGSGRVPLLLGKPSRELAQEIVETCRLDASRMCMVGDRLNTDMMFGKTVGMQTMLVLSGVTSSNEAWSLSDDDPARPDVISSSIAELIIKDNRESDGGYEGDLSSGDMTGDEGKRRNLVGNSSSKHGRHKRRKRER
jgi:phosphoglycolate phosphatase